MLRIFLLTFLTVPLSALGANWIKFDAEGNNSTFYYDSSSVKIKNFSNGKKFIQVWEKGLYENAEYNKKYPMNCGVYNTSYCNQPFYSDKTITYYDCWNDKLNYGKSVFYDKNGSVVDSSNPIVSESNSYNWAETIPDTIGEGKLKEICYAYRNRLK